jgi:hypothetical protein
MIVRRWWPRFGRLGGTEEVVAGEERGISETLALSECIVDDSAFQILLGRRFYFQKPLDCQLFFVNCVSFSL